MKAPLATDSPYGSGHERLPGGLGEALQALQDDPALCDGFGRSFVDYFTRIKRSELTRYEEAADKVDFQRREYFSRF